MKKDVIGRWVYLDIPDVDLKNVKSKVDTGAYRCSLHCNFIEEFERDGRVFLKIQTTDLSGEPIGDHAVVVEQIGKVKVKSSNGIAQERPVVLLDVVINRKHHRTEFTLSNRQDMKFPILLGRKLLRNSFIVDVSLDDPTEEE